MAQEQFSLCWDNFHKNMSSGMHSLLETEDLVDVTLAIDGQYLKAHKMVLSVCSPYFRLLFSMNPCKHPIVFLKDVGFEVMSDLLTFMYQGEVQVNQENLATFIKTAEALQIKGLTGDNNEHEDIEESKPIKRTSSGDIKHVKRFTAPAPKKQKLVHSSTPTSTSIVASSNMSIEKSDPSSCSDEMVQFKVESYEDSTHGEQFEQDSYADESVDEGQADDPDYSMMEGEEEPRAGTSGNGVIEGQVDGKASTITRSSGNHYKGRRKPEMPRYIVDGFVFHVNIVKGTPPMTYLRCLEYKRLGCHARAVIPHQGTINDIRLKQPHNHPPDYAAEEKIVFLRELKDVMLKNDKISAREVYELLSPLYPNAARETTYSSIKNKMNRWRRLYDSAWTPTTMSTVIGN